MKKVENHLNEIEFQRAVDLRSWEISYPSSNPLMGHCAQSWKGEDTEGITINDKVLDKLQAARDHLKNLAHGSGAEGTGVGVGVKCILNKKVKGKLLDWEVRGDWLRTLGQLLLDSVKRNPNGFSMLESSSDTVVEIRLKNQTTKDNLDAETVR